MVLMVWMKITLTGNTQIAELSNNKIKEFEINPKNYNFTLCSPESLQGGEPKYNAKKMLHLFEGEKKFISRYSGFKYSCSVLCGR